MLVVFVSGLIPIILTLNFIGGGKFYLPPWLLDSRASPIDLRNPRFWYKSYLIVTMDVHDQKGVPEKKITL